MACVGSCAKAEETGVVRGVHTGIQYNVSDAVLWVATNACQDSDDSK